MLVRSLSAIYTRRLFPRWAWHSRGLTSAEDLCSWHGLTLENFTRDSAIADSNENLDAVPDLPDEEPSPTASTPMLGEVSHQWQIAANTVLSFDAERPSAETLAGLTYNLLPTPLVYAFERELARYKRELAELRVSMEDEHTDAKQRDKDTKKYDQMRKLHLRSVVLNKRSGIEIPAVTLRKRMHTDEKGVSMLRLTNNQLRIHMELVRRTIGTTSSAMRPLRPGVGGGGIGVGKGGERMWGGGRVIIWSW